MDSGMCVVLELEGGISIEQQWVTMIMIIAVFSCSQLSVRELIDILKNKDGNILCVSNYQQIQWKD